MESDYTSEFIQALEAALSSFGIEPLTTAQAAQLSAHYAMLHEWNRRVNLTRIIEPEDAARLHYAESLFGGRFIESAYAALDIGSGAGFPAIPIAVLKPDLRVTALEANHKKSLFLSEAKDALALTNFTVARARLEDFDWSSYDLLMSRALDRAEAIFPAVISALGPRQRLMLYCAPDMIDRLKLKAIHEVETHSIPQAEARIIAIIGQKKVKQ